MQNNSVWERACGLTRTVVEGVRFDDMADAIVVSVRPDARARGRCGRCGRRSPGYDQGAGRRRWRGLDAGITKVFIEAEAQRVQCRVHGPTVAQVPWARHDVGHTRDFDAMAVWLTVRTSKSATCQLLRVAWRTIGSIITRVNNDVEAAVDRLAGLRRIGIDEISYKRGHRYLIVVVDHDTGRLVWAGPGRSEAALNMFFDELGEQRAADITHVSADMADWIAKAVAARAPNAVRCADPFHVVAWAIEALDIERRRAWNQAKGRKIPESSGRRGRTSGDSRQIARSRFALWKNPDDLNRRQRHQLDWIAKTDPRLWRAYLLKEGLRYVFAVKGDEGKDALDRWLSWARRSQLESFIHLAKRITKHREAIDANLEHGLSQGLIESTNTKIRLLTRIAFGFHGPQPLIALAMLALGSHPPRLPGRT
ncbi:MAG: ISL3 family transposase [Acidobacteria bacterium]|nr:ISL3 family transposase [Acidobacteriota bacterium]MCH8130389.1 ISL3 family transposase [Acidobacteriota bacterium]MCH8992078.1 ISL3 family transposase [Acidobacteriota bacterium]